MMSDIEQSRGNLTFYVRNEYYDLEVERFRIRRALNYLIDNVGEDLPSDYHDKTDRRKIYL